MKCLVTGAAGFIGSHLVEELLAAIVRSVIADQQSALAASAAA